MKPLALSTALAAACSPLLCAGSAFAAGTGENVPVNLGGKAQVAHSAGSTGGSLVRTFVGLAIVLAVIYGLYWVLKQVKSSREEKASGQGLAQLATLPLAPNRSLQLVRAGRELHLVGVSEHGVTPLKTYTEEEADQAGLLDADADLGSEGSGVRDQGSGLRSVVEDLRKRTVRR